MNDDCLKDGLAFFHLPKTSGTAIIEGLKQNIDYERFTSGHDLSLFGPCREMDSFSDCARQRVYVNVDEFDRTADLVCGHFSFSTIKDIYPNHRVFTILRDPRARLLSLWLYWRSFPDGQLIPWGAFSSYIKRARQPLVEFMSDSAVACQTDNQLVRMLLWPDPRIPEAGFIDPSFDGELLTAARAILAGLDFVGCIEEPNLDDRLSQWLGTSFVRSVSNQTAPIASTRRPNLLHEFTPTAFETMAMRTRLDTVLWREALGRVVPMEKCAALGDRALFTSVLRYLRDSVATVDDGLVAQLERAQQELRAASDAIVELQSQLAARERDLSNRTTDLSVRTAELSARSSELHVCLSERDRLKRKWQRSVSGRLRAQWRRIKEPLRRHRGAGEGD